MIRKLLMVIMVLGLSGCFFKEPDITVEKDDDVIIEMQHNDQNQIYYNDEDFVETIDGSTISDTQDDNNEELIQKDEPVKQDSMFDGYTIIDVDGGDLSGYRQANVAVDIGYGDREYWAFTNEYGQVVKVIAKEIILQSESEPLTDEGRYYRDEAKVPGTEQEDLDEGHIIADSLGGVSNAYNITPQDSTLNRYGDQAYMEKVIRDAGGCSDFTAIITYPNTKTQIPSHYEYTYTLMGNVITDSFPNENPEKPVSSTNVEDTKDTTINTPIKGTLGDCYITVSGMKYHNIPKCGSTKKSTKTTVSKAESLGLKACKKCY